MPETPGKPFTPLNATGTPTNTRPCLHSVTKWGMARPICGLTRRMLTGLLVYKRSRLSPFGVGLGQPLAASAVDELELAA